MIKTAFPGLSAGEQAVDIFLCILHSMRTLQRKVYVPEARTSLIRAIAALTKEGCRIHIEAAIRICRSNTDL